MGAVYKARQASMDRDVALKVLPLVLAENESLISRLYREAKSVGTLDHPNIVRGIAAGESQGYYYFAMEYVEGVDLMSILWKRGKSGKGRLEVGEAVDVISQVSKGLAAAHEENIIHRDIKSANVLITKKGVAKLADLGLAKRLNVEDMSAVTWTGQMMGTTYYMSPEQITDPKSVDHRCDIYSLGAMFYHLLTGEMPYSGQSVFEVIQKHQTAPIPWAADVEPQIPIVVCEIVQRMLEKSSEDRYQRVEEVVQELEALIEEADNAAQKQSGVVSGKEAYVIPEDEIVGLEASLKQTKQPSSAKSVHPKEEAEVSVLPGDFNEPAKVKAKLSRRAIIVLASCLAAFLTVVIIITVTLLHKPEDKTKSVKIAKGTKSRPTRGSRGGKKQKSSATRISLPKGLIAKQGSKIDEATGLPLEATSQRDGAEMVLIPAGEFKMGNADDGFDDERPVHTVYLDAFYIDKYEVTNGQYKKFMEATGRNKPLYWDDPNYNADKQPVAGISWDDAVAYAEWWAGKRLPTEAEWEKSARGGSEGMHHLWRDGAGGTFDDWANYKSLEDGYEYTAPVGSFPPNGYGLHDIAGNVWEWCADWYDKDYYAESPKRNPKGPSSGEYHVLRGGCWKGGPNGMRVACRNPTLFRRAAESGWAGFRCAVSVIH